MDVEEIELECESCKETMNKLHNLIMELRHTLSDHKMRIAALECHMGYSQIRDEYDIK